MESDEQRGAMENLLDGLDQHSDSLSSEQLKAELRDRGIDLEASLEKARITLEGRDKTNLPSLMNVADTDSGLLRVAEAPTRDWASRNAEEIIAAFDAYIRSAKPETVLPIRNNDELSVDDMAKILDAAARLKQRSDDQDGLQP